MARRFKDALVANVRRVSGARPIAPADPFRALRFGAPKEIKVVILGQDPYPRAGHADGLAFSAGQGKPHSLRRIFAVLQADRPEARTGHVFGHFRPASVVDDHGARPDNLERVIRLDPDTRALVDPDA